MLILFFLFFFFFVFFFSVAQKKDFDFLIRQLVFSAKRLGKWDVFVSCTEGGKLTKLSNSSFLKMNAIINLWNIFPELKN